ncbi:Sua5/YciO/YrdC/YwlC family protein [bacterium]|nr:Sua5/YciO/YrdC/YwlC family protein [bacterium]
MRVIRIDPRVSDPGVWTEAIGILRSGGVILYPTETLYGLLAVARNPDAVRRVVALKGRGADKPMPCLAADADAARAAFDPPPADLETLAARFWPGPLSIVGHAARELVGPVTAGGATIGVRVPGSKACRELARACGLLVATSANPAGDAPARDALAAAKALGEPDDLTVFDAGEIAPSRGSTIVDLTSPPGRLVREGDVPLAEIEAALSRLVPRVFVEADEELQEISPGGMRILQKVGGFRFSIDALLLAAFARVAAGERVVEIGAGTAIISLLLARRVACEVTGIEFLPALADMAARSVEENRLTDRVRILQGDARKIGELLPAGCADLVVCNPPYFAVGTGHLPPDDVRAVSRHEVTLNVRDLAVAARHLLKEGGRLDVIHRATREGELIAALSGAGLSPRARRSVIPHEGEEPKFVLLHAVRGDASFTDLPPLVVHDAAGRYTADVQAILEGRVLSD